MSTVGLHMYTYASILTHMNTHTYILYVKKKRQIIRLKGYFMNTTLTCTHTQTYRERERERKYLKYVRHPVVYSASSGLFLLLVISTALS